LVSSHLGITAGAAAEPDPDAEPEKSRMESAMEAQSVIQTNICDSPVKLQRRELAVCKGGIRANRRKSGEHCHQQRPRPIRSAAIRPRCCRRLQSREAAQHSTHRQLSAHGHGRVPNFDEDRLNATAAAHLAASSSAPSARSSRLFLAASGQNRQRMNEHTECGKKMTLTCLRKWLNASRISPAQLLRTDTDDQTPVSVRDAESAAQTDPENRFKGGEGESHLSNT
jgi:hypothetical protein